MPHFVITGRYNAEGLKGLRKDKASGREKAFSAACEARGGKCTGLYYALGDDDIYAFCELPSHVHAAALAVSIGSTGMFSDVRTIPLLTVAEADQALSDTTAYRAPGG